MKKTISVLGVLVALSLSAIAYFGAPDDSATAQETGYALNGPCAQVEVPLDEGYGVSRKIRRVSCEATAAIR